MGSYSSHVGVDWNFPISDTAAGTNRANINLWFIALLSVAHIIVTNMDRFTGPDAHAGILCSIK